MSTLSVQNAASTEQRESFRRFVGICLAMAAIKLAIEIVGNILAQRAGYGIFRDEMYYLICGRHLAFGYVDQPPMVALQARLSEILFGYDHMWSLRLISGHRRRVQGVSHRSAGVGHGRQASAPLPSPCWA